MLKNPQFLRTVIIAVGSGVGSAGLAIGYHTKYSNIGIAWVIFWIVLVIVCIHHRDKIEKEARDKAEAAQNEARDKAEAARNEELIEYFLTTFYSAMEFPPEADVRCSLLIEDENDNVLHVTDFIPRHLGVGGKGIYYHKSKGIVGEALLGSKSLAYGKPAGYDPNEWFQHLMLQWHFTQKEFVTIPLDRRGFLAQLIPQKDNKAVLGIIYCDTKDSELFDAEKNPNLLVKAERLADFFRPFL